MIGVRLALLRIPKMMRDEFYEQCLGCRPGQRFFGGRQRPSFEVGEIGRQGPQRVVAHALVEQMAQRLDVLAGQEFGELVAAFDRQHGGDGVELFGPSLDGGQ